VTESETGSIHATDDMKAKEIGQGKERQKDSFDGKSGQTSQDEDESARTADILLYRRRLKNSKN
jgi:hypothetical protein